jgi:hypothetical protein
VKREALDAVPGRCAKTDAGGALGREALDAATVASDAKIKPGEPGERSTARRSMPVTCRSTCPAASCPGGRGTDGVFWDRE